MNRIVLASAIAAGAALGIVAGGARPVPHKDSPSSRPASPTCAKALEQKRTTSHEIVQQYLARIATYDAQLHAVDHGEPARARHRRLARPRCARRDGSSARCTAFPSRSRTTSTRPTCRRPAARSRSRDLVPPYEATLAKNLEAAGAIILAKTQLTELANWVASGNARQLQRAQWLRHEPVGSAPRSARRVLRRTPRAQHGRLELRRGHERELLGRQRRHGDVGVDSQPVEPEHARRHQADGRARQPLRRHSDHRRSGHARAR